MLIIVAPFSTFSYGHIFRQMIHQVVNLFLQAFLRTYDVRTIFLNHIHLHFAPDFPGRLKCGAGKLQVVGHQLDRFTICHLVPVLPCVYYLLEILSP